MKSLYKAGIWTPGYTLILEVIHSSIHLLIQSANKCCMPRTILDIKM